MLLLSCLLLARLLHSLGSESDLVHYFHKQECQLLWLGRPTGLVRALHQARYRFLRFNLVFCGFAVLKRKFLLQVRRQSLKKVLFPLLDPVLELFANSLRLSFEISFLQCFRILFVLRACFE